MFVDIAIVDNKREQAEQRQKIIDESDWPFKVNTEIYTNSDALIEAFENDNKFYDVIITDVFMPPRGGDPNDEGTSEAGALRIKEWLGKKRKEDDDFRRVQLRFISRIEDTVDFIGEHVNMDNDDWLNYLPDDDHQRKPFIFKFLQMVDEAVRMSSPGIRDADITDNILSISRKMTEVKTLVRKYAATPDTTVLITGESGTGKEEVARAIHGQSDRKNKLFQAVNCSAIPETLLESELFGHMKGSFSGAFRNREGYFEMAKGGTILLDEIGEIAPHLQVKLLRVIQEKEVFPIGSGAPKTIDVRIVAATNRDLEKEMKEGRFRGDLFYRLNVLSIKLPPLRERPEDIPILAEHFVNKFAREHKKGRKTISQDALDALKTHTWPGNVRELQNILERAVVQTPVNATIKAVDLPQEFRATDASRRTEDTLRPLAAKYYEAASQADFNVKRVANRLNVSREAVYKQLRSDPTFKRLWDEGKAAIDARADSLGSSIKGK